MFGKTHTVLLLFFLVPGLLPAEVELAPLFRDGAVLQQGVPVPVWGTAEAWESVTVKFKGQVRTTVTDEHGRWQVRLDSLTASTEPAQLVVAGRNTITVGDVLVGEVWLCSGQSNMLFRVNEGRDAKREIAAADHPLIREFSVKSMIADAPLVTVGGEWQTCSPATVGEFTAVGYFFARDLQARLGVPVGLIKATLGGSPIEGWMSAEALARTANAAAIERRWRGMATDYNVRTARYERELAAWNQARLTAQSSHTPFTAAKPVKAYNDNDRNRPGGLYNGFIHPLEPYALAGFLWYQGEGNTGRASEYAELFQTMIAQWRSDFAQPARPFLFVQLASYDDPKDKSGQSWAWLRAAQAKALDLQNTGMAVAMDLGNPSNIHPTNKQAVGGRLARLALKNVYGLSINDRGPVFASTQREGTVLRLKFANAAGLSLVGDPHVAFAIAGEDRRFVPANAVVSGDTVVVSAVEITAPVAVRFNWVNSSLVTLQNDAGLPAAPFRSDNW